ncbi:MAG TPA: hypothetical protein VFE78_03990 [Gemmataceae bacterium]|nr:hypothetical protein [Gemmataceae bacterium]
MRTRLTAFLTLAVIAAGCLTLSLLRGQDRAATPATAPAAKAPPAATPPAAPAKSGRDFSSLSPVQRQMLLSAQRGADWLFRMHRLKGRFVYGYLPALATELEGDHYLRQAGAAFALARAARFTGEERYAARAAQALLALLDDTAPDANDAQVRYTALPPGVVNRLGAAGLLVAAINELPAPERDLLDKSEQLCNYIRRQARPDGSLRLMEGDAAPGDAEGAQLYPGEALYGLARSQKHRPAAWKLDLLRKAVAHYHPWWRAHKDMAFVPWQSAAWAEAYALTGEKAFADCVLEMNDWLLNLQYAQLDGADPRRLPWYGGFKGFADGRPVESAPDVGAAAYAEALAEGCRVAQKAGDAERHRRYAEGLVRGLQFLTTLQYTEPNTQYFADWYRPRLAGAFHASHQDGNLRIDYTQHAVSALVLYLEYVK